MACRFCERLRKIRPVDLAAIAFICVFMYIVNHFEMKQYRAQKAKEASEQKISEHKQKQEQDIQLKAYEQLQRLCFFKQDPTACKALQGKENK